MTGSRSVWGAVWIAVGVFLVGGALPAGAAVFAEEVVSYDAGSNPARTWPDDLPYDVAEAALGMPDGVTGEGSGFGTSLLSPFSAAFERGEIVSVGEGGHLTLRLGRYVEVGPGPDLGVITNVSLTDAEWPNGTATDPAVVFGDDAATVAVSADGQHWVSLGSILFDMPANYYTNATGYNTDPPDPAEVADFGKPFVPAGGLSVFDGKNWDEVLAVLDGSGGGTWLDLSPSGLDRVGYVRFSVPISGLGENFEVDAVVIANDKVGGEVGAGPVPEPAAWALFAAAGALVFRRRR